MNCHTFSTGLSSGHLGGSAMMVMLAGTTRRVDMCQPACPVGDTYHREAMERQLRHVGKRMLEHAFLNGSAGRRRVVQSTAPQAGRREWPRALALAKLPTARKHIPRRRA